MRQQGKTTAGLALGLALASLLGVASGGAGQAAPPPPLQAPETVRIEDLGWLAGSWNGEIRGAGATTRFETHYTTPQGGVILSTSKALQAEGKLSWFEFERFEVKDGLLRVTPYPNGKPSVAFTLVEYDPAAKKVVFANPEHDYPKRITYQRVAEDRLLLVVSGTAEETRAGAPVMEFSLSRR